MSGAVIEKLSPNKVLSLPSSVFCVNWGGKCCCMSIFLHPQNVLPSQLDLSGLAEYLVSWSSSAAHV